MCPTPTHRYALVCPLYSTMSLIVMPDSLHLRSPVLSVKGRDHLVNSPLCHSLARSYILALHEMGNITSQKIQILAGRHSHWLQTQEGHNAWNLWCCSNILFFVPIHSCVQCELFYLVNSQEAIWTLFPTYHSWNISLNLLNLYSQVTSKQLSVSLNRDAYS